MAAKNSVQSLNNTSPVIEHDGPDDGSIGKCGDDQWPFIINGMCCAEDTQPIVLAGGTSVICCPHDADCTTIEPTTCQLDDYNPVPEGKNPPEIATIFKGKDLPKCGLGCCIWGYDCLTYNMKRVCNLSDDQVHQPDGKPFTSVSSSSTTSVSTLPTTTATTTEDPHATLSPSTGEGSNLSAKKGPLGHSVIAGIAIGAFVFFLLTAALVYRLWRHHQKGNSSDNSRADADSTGVSTSAYSGLEKIAELPSDSRALELGDTQVVRPAPPAPVYELA
ncbi:hypothetical protein GGS21DRAFT_488997 [Xylaria nigripes]|nr:hypothetical protein GGS21DRAFT_488997 [Xylaria nigripes]